ncbi:tetratricopeptide repeat protein [Lysinibacillus sp. G4S2]|uniref:tetratricopeptide repeat protein n=1 Tax=Lysinibacillus sp. G4S2 TaxID=3055859 RepID=UPI0025A2C9FF|nr:tetratricopeptide repeat protein [Lysinibacillus sp. G4S2]MDM5247662.1 tetratricopeptide repeat protein [Lysinibacillus sp. G4S2]
MRIVDFKKSISDLNKFIYFDNNDYLREKTSNPLKLKQVIAEAENLLKINNEEDKYFLYSTIGNLYRICEEPQKAIYYLNLCLSYASEEGNIKNEIVTLIRLGEALKYDKKHSEALEFFDKAFNKCKDNNIDAYLDFALQHKGKSLMELGRFVEAEKCFISAFKLRKFKGDTTLIDSTKQALDFVQRLKNQ